MDSVIENYYKKCKMLGIRPLNIDEIQDEIVVIEGVLEENSDKLIVPKFVDSIGANSFQIEGSLRYIEAVSVKRVEEGAFYGCRELREVNIESVDIIGPDAFRICTNIRKLIGKPKSIHSCAFESCFKIKEIDLSNTTYIGSKAFMDCESLDNIELCDRLDVLDVCAFYGCKSLKNIKLGVGLKIIGEMAFEGCIGLEEIEIPSSVEVIKQSVFYGCKNLKRVSMSRDTRIERNAIPGKTEIIYYN